jgi:hypothetical protein
MDAENDGKVGDELALENMHLVAGDIFFRDAGDGGSGGDLADEDQRGEDHARLDSDGEVGEDSEEEGGEPDADLELGEAKDLGYLVPLAHVVADDHEDGGEDAERNEPGVRRGKEQHGEDGERMHHAGDGRLRTGANVGGGAGDGASGGKAAEERREDVGDALGDEFDAWVVAIA